jgi:hypothetical protein
MIAKGIIKPRDPTEQQIADRARDQQGRFTKSQPQNGQAARPPASSSSTLSVPAVETPLPKSLKRDLEQHWKTAPDELRKAWLQRDQDYEKGIGTYKQQAEAANQVLAEFKQYEPVMRLTGATPVSAIRSILPTMAVLNTGSPQEKAFVLARAMQQYGVPLEHIQQVMQGGASAVPQDTAYNQLAQQVQSLQSMFQTTRQQAEQAEQQRLAAIAESYGKDKPHFEQLRSQMWALLQAQNTAEAQGVAGPLGERGTTSLWGEQQWIDAAYKAAIRLSPELYESELRRQRDEAARAEREKANQVAQASRAAAVQVRGAPASSVANINADPRDRRSVIAAALRSRMN